MVVILWVTVITAIFLLATSMSIVFTKADKPSWGFIVPIYGIILLCDIAGKPRWWTLLCLIPFINIIAYVVLSIGVARNFDRSDGFGVGLVLLPVIFYLMLAFGDSEYSPCSPIHPKEEAPAVKATSASPISHPPQEATPMKPPMTPTQKEAASPTDSVRQRPKLARCPICRSTTFSVIEEAGSWRCSNCHSVLPSYARGNK